MPTARFDDLRLASRRSLILDRPESVLVAYEPGEVGHVLTKAEDAVRSGAHVAGFVSYEAASGFDPHMSVSGTGDTFVEGLPLAWFGVFSKPQRDGGIPGSYRLGPWEPDEDPAAYRSKIEAIRDHIRDGDAYQVNHTFRLHADFGGDASGLYMDLIRSQSCGYGAFIDTGDWAVVSASPEVFMEWRDGVLLSRPMKGTARRGVRLADDERQRALLVDSEKDRAENVMIVDMVRNDLGRISRAGSVEVPALFTAEKYDTVWQLTSTVTGYPTPGITLSDVFGAMFPAASITGAPKIAAMEIISRMEEAPRGVYCGTVGFGRPGSGGSAEWVFNVAIRTVLVDRRRGTAHYGTGGGITIGSTHHDEYSEALLKAEVLQRRSVDFQLLETMAFRPGTGIHLLEHHLGRLADSAAYFAIPLDSDSIRVGLLDAVEDLDTPARLRLLVDRTGAARIELGPLPATPRRIRLALDDVPVESSDVFLHHKTTNRDVYDEAMARHPDADDVILVNERGEVTETTVGNLAVLLGDVWVTPPLESGCLAGTERAARLAAGEIIEAVVTVKQLVEASAVARINSVRGWEPAAVMIPQELAL